MSFQIAWWLWIILGIALIMLEIVLPSFIALWFGLGAVVVGLTAWAFPAIGEPAKMLIWIISSSVFVYTWFK